MMPSNRFPEVTTSAPTPLLAISSTASYTVWAGYGHMGIARVDCPSLQRRPGCKIDPPLPRDIGLFCMHMERDFPLHCSYLASAKAHTTGWTTFTKSSYFIRIAS